MATDIDTATDHLDLFDRLVAFLQLGITTPGGPDWELLRQDTSALTALFRAPGLSSTEEIHVGIGIAADAGADKFALKLWMFKAYVEGLGDFEQPGTSSVRYMALWDTTMPYWFIANAQRLMVVAKVSTNYMASYIGKFLPYGTPGEYPLPYYIGTPSSAFDRYSVESNNVRNFFDPSETSLILHPSGQWWSAGNFRETSGEQTMSDSYGFMWPYSANIANSSQKDRWRECRNNIDGSYTLFPLRLLGDLPQRDWYGELDGAFAVSGFSAASEDIVSIGGVNHLIVQDIFRTNRYNYCAIALE